MLNCPDCAQELPVGATYCHACGSQARCKSCSEPLKAGVRVCMKCNARVGDGLSGSAEHQSQPVADLALNRITLVESEKRRSLHAEFTDNAVGLLGEALGLFCQTTPTPGSSQRLRP